MGVGVKLPSNPGKASLPWRSFKIPCLIWFAILLSLYWISLMLISSGYSGIFRNFLHRLAFSPPFLVLLTTWLGFLRPTCLFLLVYLRRVFLGEGGRWWGGYSLLFQPICLAISLQWAVFLLLWLLKDSGSVSGWCRFYLEFHVLFSLLQCFCSFESEVEVRLLSVHFLLLLILCLLCVCVCVWVCVSSVMVCWVSWMWGTNQTHFMAFSILAISVRILLPIEVLQF